MLTWLTGTQSSYIKYNCMHAVLVGYVEYPVIGLESGLAPAADLSPVLAASANLTAHSNTTNTFAACPEAGTGPTGVVYATWKVRCSFPVYLIAMAATAGAPQPASINWGRSLFVLWSMIGQLQ